MIERQMELFARLQAEDTGPRLRYDHPGANSFYDVTYAAVPGFRPLTLDLHIPSQGSAPFPVLVWVHGGGWFSGHRAVGALRRARAWSALLDLPRIARTWRATWAGTWTSRAVCRRLSTSLA